MSVEFQIDPPQDITIQFEGQISSGVTSVNGQTGTVVLDAEDVGALASDTPIPSKTSDLTNDSGFQNASQVDSKVIVETQARQDADTVIQGNIDAHTDNGNIHVTEQDKNAWNAKSNVSVSPTGTATDEVQYITINGVEKKLAGGGGGGGSGLPTGGSKGQVLQKNSATDYDASWGDVTSLRVTLTLSGSTYTSDKSFSEIESALNSNRHVYLIDDENVRSEVCYVTATKIVFMCEHLREDAHVYYDLDKVGSQILVTKTTDTYLTSHQSLSAYRTSAQQDVIDATFAVDSELKAVAKSGNYADLSNRPSKVSDFTNDSGFITKAVNDLQNYYLASNTYTKSEVDAIVAGKVVFEVVSVLPATGEANKIYLVPASSSQVGNVKDEYIWVNSAWEKIGSTSVDLSNYYTKTEADGKFVEKVSGKGLSENDYTTTEKNKLAGIEAGAEVNVQADWNEADSTKDDYIKNKPTIPTKLSELTDDLGSSPVHTHSQYATPSDLANKVDKIAGKGLSTNDYDNTEKAKVDNAYAKPATGIPKTDLDSDVQTSLEKADSAIQSHQDISGKADVSALNSHTGNTSNPHFVTKAQVGLGNVPNTDFTTPVGNATTHIADSSIHVTDSDKSNWNGKSEKVVTGSLSLPTASWTGASSPYSQVVTITGSTANSMIDLQMDSTALAQMLSDGTNAIYVENNNNVLTVYAIGEKPSADMTVQYSRTEVA